jgi:hypothetical protein
MEAGRPLAPVCPRQVAAAPLPAGGPIGRARPRCPHGWARRPPRARAAARAGAGGHHGCAWAWSANTSAGAGSTALGTIFLPIPDLQLQLRDATGEEESTYLSLGDLRPGAGGRPLGSSPDEGAEEGLLQLRVRGEKMRPPHPSGARRETGWRCFLCFPP